MTSPNILSLLILLTLSLSSLFILPSFSFPYTLQLSQNFPTSYTSQNPQDIISNIVKSTLHRAHYIKHQNKENPHIPLFPRRAGEYSISLSLGTPPQKIPAIFDTGSSLVWVPCTSHYTCSNCTRKNATTITTFKPRLSSSKKHVNCHNKKCHWLDEPGRPASCPNCNRSSNDCTKPCFYRQVYGTGYSFGIAIFENLNLINKFINRFFVGCSKISDQAPEGIVGFGRSPMSLPYQLNLTKFSYCLVSHKFDDTSKSSNLILGNSGNISGVSYTPLLKNPTNFPSNIYYYVQLEQITVNHKKVKLPRKLLFTDSKGNGGTIVDSGSTFTSLASDLFEPMAIEYITQLPETPQKRVIFYDSSLGNLLCVNVTGAKRMALPELVFEFKGGAKMDIPVDNYLNAGPGLKCLPFTNVTFDLGSTDSGPAVILGNYQQQNFHVEYDLKNQRLGFKKQIC